MKITIEAEGDERVRVILAPKDGGPQERFILEPGGGRTVSYTPNINIHIQPATTT